jgi:hypothetical protein
MAEQSRDSDLKQERRESVNKAFEDPGSSIEPDPDVYQPLPGTENVGESISKRAEDTAKEEQEAGRHDTGNDDSPAGRPTGESTSRDKTGVNPDGGK